MATNIVINIRLSLLLDDFLNLPYWDYTCWGACWGSPIETAKRTAFSKSILSIKTKAKNSRAISVGFVRDLRRICSEIAPSLRAIPVEITRKSGKDCA